MKNDHRSKFSNNSSLSSTTMGHIWITSYISFIISLLTGRYELNWLTSLPMCGFIAQLVEQIGTGYRRGHGFESRWRLDFFQASSFQLLNLENLLQWSFFFFMILFLLRRCQYMRLNLTGLALNWFMFFKLDLIYCFKSGWPHSRHSIERGHETPVNY